VFDGLCFEHNFLLQGAHPKQGAITRLAGTVRKRYGKSGTLPICCLNLSF
jgi:hypothetical protein